MYAVFKGEVLVALKDEYSDARLLQLSTGNPLEFFVTEVHDLMELKWVMEWGLTAEQEFQKFDVECKKRKIL